MFDQDCGRGLWVRGHENGIPRGEVASLWVKARAHQTNSRFPHAAMDGAALFIAQIWLDRRGLSGLNEKDRGDKDDGVR
jgi:hypothetical protein